MTHITPSFNPKYAHLIETAASQTYSELGLYLQEHLIKIWINDYKTQCNRLTDIGSMYNGSFEYIYDDCESLLRKGVINDDSIESRMLAVTGTSSPKISKRDDYRLKGWLGKTETIFGKEWDKGHFIAHSIGGAIDSIEINVFPQKRALNRGWSEEGKIFRKMETYCFENPDTYCFTRPIYSDQSSRPSFLEFGILKHDKTLWTETFNNH
ncbi:MAG TPA: hypothetical protein VGF79_04980 [Bacteroidia bacterium]